MEPGRILKILRKTYCGVCFCAFESFSIKLDEFQKKHKITDFLSIDLNVPSSITRELSSLVKDMLSNQTKSKEIIFCSECPNTVHARCLPRKDSAEVQLEVLGGGLGEVKSFKCLLCRMGHSEESKKKNVLMAECYECGQGSGVLTSIECESRQEIKSQFVHPVCGMYSTQIKPLSLQNLDFFKYALRIFYGEYFWKLVNFWVHWVKYGSHFRFIWRLFWPLFLI